MEETLRILIIEDVAADAELIERELRKTKIAFTSRRVDNREAFLRELEDFDPDLILSDNTFPSFDGMSALALVQEKCPEVPFIFVSGTIGEELAIESLKRGATDYVLKNRLSRLVPAVQRALQEKEERIKRQQAEEQLRKLFRALEYSPSTVVVTDLQGSIEYVNPKFTQITGYTPEEVLGHNPHILKSGQTPAETYKQLWDTITVGGEWRGEFINKKKNGELFWELAYISPVKNEAGVITHYVAVKEDITERKRAEEALQESEIRYRTLAESTNMGVWQITPEGYTIYLNPAMKSLLEIEDQVELEGITYHSFFTPESLVTMRNEHAKRSQGISSAYEVEMVGKRGRRRNVIICGAPLMTPGGKLQSLIGSFHDLTERKHLEAQLLQSQKMEAVGTLAGGVAHDFNNLLTAMMGNLEIVRLKLLKGEAVGLHLEEIETVAQRAVDLTRQLLAFSRRQILQPVPLNLNDTINNMNQMLSRLIGEHIQLELRLEGKLGLIKADPAQIEQVIMNLCVNARDAMPKGGKLTLTTQNVSLDAAYVNNHPWVEKGDYVLLEVTDTGCGMDKATLERIFEPFFTTKEVGMGTGLGLSMVFGIVKQHQGNIHVYSEPGRGTTFKIYLPRTEEKVAVEEVKEAPKKIEGGQETILLAEDEETLQEAIQNILEMFGYTVLLAKDGQEAVEVYARDKERIDLVILDAVMPRMGGMEAAEYIYKLNPGQKILFSSGYTVEGLHESYIIPEGMHFIQKPYRAKDLAQKVREVLEG